MALAVCCLISYYLCINYPLYDIDMINVSFMYTLDGLVNDVVSLPELLFYLNEVCRWFDISPCLMQFDKRDVFIVCELCECLKLFIVTNCCIWTLLISYSKCCCSISVYIFLMVLALHNNIYILYNIKHWEKKSTKWCEQ